ncbi:MAG: sigma-70 family RNA polymerase sigma factor [Cyanobacteriota bacterium]|nr:sigma-70 family RNA polymerase sigma factor [Cyanobacteriota bacterium]
MLTDDCSDAFLVEQCQKGERQCFRYLYQRYQGKVRSTLYQLCGTLSLDDLVQEVFLRVWKGLPKLKQPSTFSTWLYRITWNVATDRRRTLAKHYSFNSKLKTIDSTRDTESLSSSADASDLMQIHYQDLVQRGLAHLSFEHRTVIVLHDLEELPQKEIAEILNIPLGTVKSRIFHARASLRKFLQREGVNL